MHSSNKLYLEDTHNCHEICPVGYYANATIYRCLKCSTQCAACTEQSIRCTACASGLKLVVPLSICAQECNQVTFFDNDDSTKCLLCEPPCLTCSIKYNKCASCSVNFLSNSRCVYACPDG